MRETLRAAWLGLRLICPACEQGRIFHGLLTLHAECPVCGVAFEREEGDFLGAMVVAYGITSLLVCVGIGLVELFADLDPMLHIALWGCFAILFMLGTYRNMKGLWIGILHSMVGLRRHDQ